MTSQPVIGFDCFAPVSDTLIAQVQARFGQAPAFCGRYVSGVDYHGPGEYRLADESAVLFRHGLALLPIGRYTTRVGGSLAEGLQDGADQAEDLKESLGPAFRDGLLLFLDVEADTPLSADYWTGWSHAVSAAGCLPAIYGSTFAGRSTWTALRQAMAAGAPCAGLWGAWYKSPTPLPVPEWTDDDTLPQLPDGSRFTDVPVLVWQYCGDYGGIDASVVNPAYVDTLGSHLAIPGASTSTTAHDAKVFTHDGKASVILDGVVYPLRSLTINGTSVIIEGSL